MPRLTMNEFLKHFFSKESNYRLNQPFKSPERRSKGATEGSAPLNRR